MQVSLSTEESVQRIARALESLAYVSDSHTKSIAENAGLVEEMLSILYLIDKRVTEIAQHVGMEEVEQLMEEVEDVPE